MQDFYNQIINLDSIPQYQNSELTPIHSNYKKVIIANYAFFLLLFIIAFSIGLYFRFFPTAILLLIFTGLLILLIVVLMIHLKEISKRGFAFRTHDIICSSGLLFKKSKIVPTNRIQHISINQGFFSKWFNLCSLKVYTASPNGSDISIHGILHDDALRYKTLILQQINTLAND